MGRYEEMIEIIARGVLVVGDRLLACRGKKNGNTYLPGGHVDFGESARAALEREILEEMGLKSKAGRFLGVAEHRFLQKGRERAEINLVFEMTVEGVKLPPLQPDSMETYIEFDWLSMKALTLSNLEPAVLKSRLSTWLAGDEGLERYLSLGTGN